MRLVLEVTSGPHKGKRIDLDEGQSVRVGRTRKADVALTDNFLSSLHFALECDAKGCRVRDLKSRNGTKLNDELVIEAPLKNGDKLFAGHTDFIVAVEPSESAAAAEKAAPKARPKSESPRRMSRKLAPAKPPVPSHSIEPPVSPAVANVPQPTRVQPSRPVEQPPAPPLPSEPKTPSPPEVVVSHAALDSYDAATPDGRLFHILSSQPQPLKALVDAVHDPGVIELLRIHGEDHQSLYNNVQDPSIAPHLITLPPRSQLLKQMIQKGWGRGWGVYLTCPLSLSDLRQYFRMSLMVTMPDGMELFSRFYDPRFFRGFLESCSADEAEKFFGPVTSYFMEDERPEILLQFTKSKTGVEKKGHLLSDLG